MNNTTDSQPNSQMASLNFQIFTSICFAGILLMVSPLSAQSKIAPGTLPEEVKQFFDERGKIVITFVGYSGSGYEDESQMLAHARNVLSVHTPKKAIVNIGATSSGIGAVYQLAKKMGFETTGIVSTQAQKYKAEISPKVDRVFFVTDETWGGFQANSQILAPTSQAMVECSDIVIGIGGGDVARDELTAAKREGKTIKYFPADMNHKKANEKASKKGDPAPTDFKGSAFTLFGDAGGE